MGLCLLSTRAKQHGTGILCACGCPHVLVTSAAVWADAGPPITCMQTPRAESGSDFSKESEFLAVSAASRCRYPDAGLLAVSSSGCHGLWPHHSCTVGWNVQELQEQKAELVAKVQALKAGLQEWRIKVDNDVKNYKDVSEAAAAACGRA